MADTARRFDEAEVDAILQRVIERQQGRGELDRGDLVEAARQLGVEAEEVDAAIAEHDEQAEVDREVARWRARHEAALRRHAASFVIVNAGLLLLNALATPGVWWFLWPLVGGAIGLAAQAWALREGPVMERLPAVIRREARRAERARLRAERVERDAQRRARAASIERAASELGGAVKQGVAQIFDSLGRALSETAQRAQELAPRTGVRVDASAQRVADPAREEAEIEAELDRLRAHRRGRG
jgi:hypothetical protein